MCRAIVASLALSTLLHTPLLAEEITIKTGDTLSEIAARYKIPIKELITINGLTDANQLKVGAKITIPARSQEKNNEDDFINHLSKVNSNITR